MAKHTLEPEAFVTTGDAGIAPVVAAAQRVWKRLQKAKPSLPDATIVIKRDSRAWGHTTTQKVWGAQKVKGRGKKKVVELTDLRYEVMLSGELLSKGGREVITTLLHEATHALNLVDGIVDCDVNGRHSKGKFGGRATAEFGLTIEDAGNYLGWTLTSMDDETAKRWRVEIAMMDRALKSASVAHHPKWVTTGGITIVPPKGLPPVKPPRNKNLGKAWCECPEDSRGWRPSLRASKQVLDLGIRCEACQGLFTIPA